ncbi:hypothetical protein [Streptomyces sp. NPDC046909]|uniref:hypothetical protein n=1 Tax=Streptomyces sp. NPDC046909 TaxID=3155617 RepID=UPI0033EF8D64
MVRASWVGALAVLVAGAAVAAVVVAPPAAGVPAQLPSGSPAAQSALWVVARADGSVVRSSGLTWLNRSSAGVYEARFGRDVSDCVFTASVGEPGKGAVPPAGLVFTAGGHQSRAGVYVETKNSGGGLTDLPFQLTVDCAGGDRAVVGPGGLVRGSAASFTRFGVGRYEVVFGHDVSACAYRVTVGDPGAGLVYYPALAFAAGGHLGPYGVYVETKNLGGGLMDAPFHLAVHCAQDPRTGYRGSAVVDAAGGLVRGDGVRSAARTGTGRYEVRFSAAVESCARVASIADPGNGLVYAPGLVFTAGSSFSTTGVTVETRTPDGTLSDRPFHLYVDCGKRALSDENISVLSLNLQGTDSSFGPWRDRHGRLAAWMGATQTVPDLLVLQETPASKCWFLGGCDPKDYEAVFGLMARIESATGVRYRAALLSTGPSVEGWNPLYQGRAVLYNPQRLRNITPVPGTLAIGSPYDSLPLTPAPRASYPCTNPPANWAAYCARVDSTTRDTKYWGPHWAIRPAAFARFALVERWPLAVHSVDVWDVHTSSTEPGPDYALIAQAVDQLELAVPPAPGGRLFPPVLAGDFNATRNDIDNEVATGTFAKYEIAAFPPAPPASDDVVGILVGEQRFFPARFAASGTHTSFLPTGGPGLCGDLPSRWSDHCAVYTELASTP